jgi:hypothetical protein
MWGNGFPHQPPFPPHTFSLYLKEEHEETAPDLLLRPLSSKSDPGNLFPALFSAMSSGMLP